MNRRFSLIVTATMLMVSINSPKAHHLNYLPSSSNDPHDKNRQQAKVSDQDERG
jgi:hypothetical protein